MQDNKCPICLGTVTENAIKNATCQCQLWYHTECYYCPQRLGTGCVICDRHTIHLANQSTVRFEEVVLNYIGRLGEMIYDRLSYQTSWYVWPLLYLYGGGFIMSVVVMWFFSHMITIE